MNKNVEKFEQIEAYIQGKLSEVDKQLFEKQMSENMEFKKEVMLTASSIKAIEAYHDEQLKQKLDGFHTNMEHQNQRNRFKQYLLIAASLFICFSVAFLVFKNTNNTGLASIPTAKNPNLLNNKSVTNSILDKSPKLYEVIDYKDGETLVKQIEIQVKAPINQQRNSLIITPYYFFDADALTLYTDFSLEDIKSIFYDKDNELYYIVLGKKVYTFEMVTTEKVLLRVFDDCILSQIP